MSTVAIGRDYSLLIGKEATAGTEASSFTAVPLMVAPFIKPVVEFEEIEDGIGRIEAVNGKCLVSQMSETAVEGKVGTLSFGHLLGAAFGQTASPTLIETSVYSHAFSVKNDNNHLSYSLVEDGLVGQELSLFNLIDTLSLDLSVGSIAKFSGTYKGKIYAGTSGKTVTFPSDTPCSLKISNMVIKLATTVAGLSGASAVPVRNVNFEIAKNVETIFESGSIDPTSINNQQLGVTGDMEITYENDTYRDLFTAGTKQAMSITITGTSLIGATKFEELTFTFASLNLDEWDRTTDNNTILTQTIGFTAEYSTSDTSMVTATLQNTQNTQY